MAIIRKKRAKSGAHVQPRRLLSASEEQWKRWDSAAERARLTWADWARGLLDAAAPGQKKT